jgi:N-acetylglucosaminyldiphosphoundecaprenol N-acetyl-beta-D-mannosaminyltransferase
MKAATPSLSTPAIEPDITFLLGLPFHRMTMADTVATAVEVVESRTPHYFVTANADFVAQAHDNQRLRDILVHAHRAVCDGMPLIWLSRLFPPALPERVAGSDLVFELFREGNARQWRFFFLGSDEATLKTTRAVLATRYPSLQVCGYFSPPFAAVEDWPNEAIAQQIQSTAPDVLLVAVGCPKQEYWIAQHARQLNIPLSVGIGASLDFIAGRQVRAPRWMQKTGTEWIWRMATNPSRLVARYWKDFRYLAHLSYIQWRLTRRKQTRALEMTSDTAPAAADNATGAVRLCWVGSIEIGNLGLHPLPEGPSRALLLDLSDVTFIDSAGVGHLLKVARRCRQAGQPFALFKPSPQVEKIIACLHLQREFPVVTDAAQFPPAKYDAPL